MHSDPAAEGALITLLFFYFVPTMVAAARGHRAKLAIFLANLFFGWTLLGWIVALIWAANSNVWEKGGSRR